MSDGIPKLYQFLFTQKDWVKKADTQKQDGIITKTEFRNFVNKEWTPAGMNASDKNDIINDFWNSIDNIGEDGYIDDSTVKNKFALDKEEMAKISDTVEIYEQFELFVNNLQAPKDITNKAGWKSMVKEQIGALLQPYIDNGGEAKDVQKYLEGATKELVYKATVYSYGEEVFKELGPSNLIKKYGLEHFTKEPSFINLLDNYIKENPEGITRDSIKQLVSEYLESQGFNNDISGNNNNVDNNYNPNELSNLQKALLGEHLEHLKEDIKKDPNYSKFKKHFDKAIETFINNLKETTTVDNYNEVMKYGIEDFKNSDVYKNLGNLIAYTPHIETVLDTVAQKGSKIYRDVLDKISDMVLNGEFTDESGNFDEAKLETAIYEVYEYEQNKTSASGLKENFDKDINRENADIQKAGNDYCDNLIKLDRKNREFIEKVLGNNYKNELQNLDEYEIIEKINEIANLVRTNEIYNKLFDNIKNSYQTSFGINLTIDNLNNGIDSKENSDLNFEVKVLNGDFNITQGSNSLTITSKKNYMGTGRIEINALVNGKVIKSKTINITVKEKDSSSFKEENNFLVGDTSKTIKEILEDKNTIGTTHYMSTKGAGNVKGVLLEGAKYLLDNIKSNLSGYDSSKIDKVYNTMINYYTAAIGSFWEDSRIEYKNEVTGENSIETATIAHEAHRRGKDVDSVNKIGGDSNTGIYIGQNKEHRAGDKFNMWIDVRVMLNKFMNLLSQA